MLVRGYYFFHNLGSKMITPIAKWAAIKIGVSEDELIERNL